MNRPIASRCRLPTWVWVAVLLGAAISHCAVGPGSRYVLAQPPVSDGRLDLLAPYEWRFQALDAEREWEAGVAPIPADFQPWWTRPLEQPLWKNSQALSVQVETVVLGALHYSPKIRAISDLPMIRQTAVVEADANFDTYTFIESKLIKTDEPVGNTLTTGGPDRLIDRNYHLNTGLRRRTRIGGEWELAQKFGYQESNSLYFTPPEQGNARASLTFTQPLLNGSGRAYNQSIGLLADIDSRLAMDQFLAELQNHLFEVSRAYWNLYIERAAYLQKQRLYEQSVAIVQELEARQRLDASQSQLLRARSAAAKRQADVHRAAHGVRSAEARLIALVNDPELLTMQKGELIPVQRPYCELYPASTRTNALIALQHRPEIDQAIREIRAASVRAGVATKDLLPALNLVVAAYLTGLQGNGDIGQAFADQFNVGDPSYSVGLQFDMPLGNRAAKARQQRQLLEVRRYSHQLQAAVAGIMNDVENAVREIDSAHRDMHGRYYAMIAAAAEIQHLTQRWRLLPGEDRTAGFVLEHLLDAQARLADEEYNFLAAQVNYNLAQSNLHRATGTLLQMQQIELIQSCQTGLPTIEAVRTTPAPVLPPAIEVLPAPEPISSRRTNGTLIR